MHCKVLLFLSLKSEKQGQNMALKYQWKHETVLLAEALTPSILIEDYL